MATRSALSTRERHGGRTARAGDPTQECRGQDSNLGTPARADLESAAFGRSATPARSPHGGPGYLIVLRVPEVGALRVPTALRCRSGRPQAAGRLARTRTFPCLRRRGRGGTGPVAPGHRPGTSERAGRPEAGCAPSAPPPRTGSSRGSRPPRTPRGVGRCTASRSFARARRTDPPRPASGRTPHARPARRGRRSAPRRSGPSGRYAGPGVLPASRLGILAYRTVDRRGRDGGPAARAVLGIRRGRHGPDRPGRRGRRGRVDPRGDVRTCHPGRDDSHRSGSDAGGRHRGTRDRRAGRQRRGRGLRPRLRQRVAALGAEQRPLSADLPAVEADGHVRRNVNSLKRRRVGR